MEWFYEQNGQQIGPVSQAELVRLIINRRIQPQTLVWHPKLGDQWKPAGKVGLIVPVPQVGQQGVKVPKGLVSGDMVSSFWAWIFLLVPNALDIGLGIVSQVWEGSVEPNILTVLALLALRLFPMYQDRKNIIFAGGKPPSLWWFLFFPGYFWQRRKTLKKGMLLLLCSILIVFIRVGVFCYNPPSEIVGENVHGWSQFVHSPAQSQGEKKTHISSHAEEEKRSSDEKQLNI